MVFIGKWGYRGGYFPGPNQRFVILIPVETVVIYIFVH